ncbi:MAG TPA: aminotransferase class IV [Corynebacterium sp.]|nr:aminotransferase class IV [Corynebacterium sp.]
MTEYVTTFAMRAGRVPHFARQLAWLRDTAAVSPMRLAEVRDQLQELGGSREVRPVIRADQGAVSVSIRPLATFGPENVLDADPIPDHRARPVFTGPDLGWQNRQLALLANRELDEGLLVDESGAVISGVRSSIFVIRPGEVIVPAHPRTTHSVTREAVLALLAERGVTVTARPQGMTIPEVRTNETWTVNAVAGVRQVTGWAEYGSVLTAPTLAEAERSGVPTAAALEVLRWDQAETV